MGTSDWSLTRFERRFGSWESRVSSGTPVHRICRGARGWGSAPASPSACCGSGPRVGGRHPRDRADRNSAVGAAARARARLAYRPWSSRGFRSLLGPDLMPEREVKIVNKLGIHARPAAEIVKTAGKFKSNITIIRDDLEVNAKSIMGVMMLAAELGATIVVRALGDDADAALDALAAVIANKFGES